MPKKRLPVHTTVHKKYSKKWIGYLAILINVIAWGVAPILIKSGLNEIPAEVFLFYRFLIASILALPSIFILKKAWKHALIPKNAFTLTWIGLLAHPITLLVLFEGVVYTTSTASTIIASAVPIMIAFGSAMFFHERFKKIQIIGICIATGATILFSLITPQEKNALHPLYGNFLVIVHNVLWAASVLVMKKYAHAFHPFVMSVVGWIAGIFMCAGIVAIRSPQWFNISLLLEHPQAVWSIVYMAIFGSMIAYTAYQVAQSPRRNRNQYFFLPYADHRRSALGHRVTRIVNRHDDSYHEWNFGRRGSSRDRKDEEEIAKLF
ncbi:MAG: Inner membrane protein [Microgenomates group bacterium GW2011_GWF1_44_10]|nr:MAG: Inner membrane protein [Microgenomates group bacterium GW2011_GWF1_44_10]